MWFEQPGLLAGVVSTFRRENVQLLQSRPGYKANTSVCACVLCVMCVYPYCDLNKASFPGLLEVIQTNHKALSRIRTAVIPFSE